MPRANRYFTPRQIWHITHRCHNRDFLFRFRNDRIRWMQWLFHAKKRFEILILNYIVTSNHIHLLLADSKDGKNIPQFMQLLQGRTAQEYNLKKNRKGAFWEDRYHATAIESGEHLIRCMIYLSLNMVRAGVVNDPIHWKESGYYEIQYPKKRCAIITYNELLKLLNIGTIDQLQKNQQQWINNAMEEKNLLRDSKWSEAIAVGSEKYLENIRHQLSFRVKNRTIKKSGEEYELSESEIPYKDNFYKKI